MRPLSEQTILVTGATDGHGRELARRLAASGPAVLVHGRDEARGRETVEQLRAETGNDKLTSHVADLASLDDVRSLAGEIADKHDRLDALVNNAGIGTTTNGDRRRELSRDGYELRFAVNYLAGYMLTRLLLPLLERSSPARIVNVASAGQAPVSFDDPMLEHDYDGGRAYRQSKLAQIMFTFDLAEELADRGVTANCLHPATYMNTKIVRADDIAPTSSVEDGAKATLRLIADEELDGVTGRYYDGLNEADPDGQARDPDARRRLRALSERLAAAPRSASRRRT
jgi:NAD(P)-dependent dehydrogenase (short-subunit alcohol dehydrogenase family)